MAEKENNNESRPFRCVNFRLGEECYGQDIGYIHEVNRVQNITEVPGAPEYILGVINLRGSVIPVMNLRKRLGLPAVDVTKDSRVIVIEYQGSLLGMLVDSVHHVLEIPYNDISDTPESTITEKNIFISGIGKVEEKLVFLIDTEKIFAEESTIEMLMGQGTEA
ncbi:MAG: chemotaxis protein CheW [Bacteroidales bacterium]|nr:chemotaxis protein CheW [Candidatus Latescibacterota bacterium]